MDNGLKKMCYICTKYCLSAITYNNRNESEKYYAKWQKPDMKDAILYMPFIWDSRKGKTT